MYIGAIFVPIEFKNHSLATLNNLRCLKHKDWSNKSECSHPCGFHDKNNTEIHYKDLHKSRVKFQIAKNWIIHFINHESCQKHRKLAYLNILGLNLSNINLELFGENPSRDLTIYNRFYRTVLKAGIGYFFKDYKRVVIRQICHDRGSQESHELFSWHSIKRIDLEYDKVKIEEKEIKFIDSDHRKSGLVESNFIQLIDLILGATFSCLHNPSEKKEKIEIGLAFKPVLETLLDRKRNQEKGYMVGSYYKSNYYRTYQVSFFPKKMMELDEALRQLDVYSNQVNKSENTSSRNNFYFDRPILLTDPHQRDLSRWCQ